MFLFMTLYYKGYSAGGYVVEAFRILNFMMAQSIQPNSYTLTALMKTCVKKEDWSRARELLIIGALQSPHSIPYHEFAHTCLCICARISHTTRRGIAL